MIQYILPIILLILLIYLYYFNDAETDTEHMTEHMTNESNLACQNVASIYNTGNMTVSNLTSTDKIAAKGGDAGLQFFDRQSQGQNYEWLSQNGNAYLYNNNGGNIVKIDKTGNLTANSLTAGKPDSTTYGNIAGNGIYNVGNNATYFFTDKSDNTKNGTMFADKGTIRLQYANNDVMTVDQAGVLNTNRPTTVAGTTVPIVQFITGKDMDPVNFKCPAGTSNIGGTLVYGGCNKDFHPNCAVDQNPNASYQNGTLTVIIPPGTKSIDKAGPAWGDPNRGINKIWNATYYCQ
jgi:hypothetical protein